ncbi:hypothetical protein GE21DRAFT_1288356 [Neurospora crassa]|nr:hypothetical protein GE21DRAFT_1288356 [Neurospora crassa]
MSTSNEQSTQPLPASVSYRSSKVFGENPANCSKQKQANGNDNGMIGKGIFLFAGQWEPAVATTADSLNDGTEPWML